MELYLSNGTKNACHPWGATKTQNNGFFRLGSWTKINECDALLAQKVMYVGSTLNLKS